jgi:hypothetical protein
MRIPSIFYKEARIILLHTTGERASKVYFWQPEHKHFKTHKVISFTADI